MGIDSAIFMGLSLIAVWGGFVFFLTIALRKMWISSFYKRNKNSLFFFDSKKEPKNYLFFCKKRGQKNNSVQSLKVDW